MRERLADLPSVRLAARHQERQGSTQRKYALHLRSKCTSLNGQGNSTLSPVGGSFSLTSHRRPFSLECARLAPPFLLPIHWPQWSTAGLPLPMLPFTWSVSGVCCFCPMPPPTISSLCWGRPYRPGVPLAICLCLCSRR